MAVRLNSKQSICCCLLFALGGLAGWADSEAVLPAYLIGMILAGSVGKDHILIRRLRTLCFGFLTPFYFIRAGSFVSVPDLIAAPAAFLVMLVVKLITKIVGVYPVTRAFGSPHKDGMYTTLLMSTGLTFGTISSLFGLSHGIIDQAQYSGLVAAVIGSAVVPTLIANAFYLPRHLLQTWRTVRGRRFDRVGRRSIAQSSRRTNMDVPKDAMLLRIFFGEDDRFEHQPLYEAIVQKAREYASGGCNRSSRADGLRSLQPLAHR